MQKIWGIDTFRGVAALLVFLFHYWTFFPPCEITCPECTCIKPLYQEIFDLFTPRFLFSAGHLGVDFFFVISGFLVTLSLLRRTTPLSQNPEPIEGEASNNKSYVSPSSRSLEPGVKRYLSARIRRIVPLAWAVIFPVFLVQQNFLPENFLDLFVHLFFLQGFFENFYHSINPVMWTLSVEMMFYLLLPILWIFLAQKNISRFLWISGGFVFLSFCWRAVVFYFFPEASSTEKIFLSEQLWGRFDQFFLGIILAVATIRNYKLRITNYWIFLLLGIFSLFLSFSIFSEMGSGFREIFWMQVFLHSFVGLGFFFFLLWFVQQNFSHFTKKIFSPFIWCGEISYGIYLFHFPILSFTKKTGFSPEISFLSSLLLTLIISWISFEFFEKKFLKRGS